MKKVSIISLSLFTILLSNVASFNLTKYHSALEKLALDEYFLKEFTKWSLELMSERDYFYGKHREPFPCSTKNMRSPTIPTSVHAL